MPRSPTAPLGFARLALAVWLAAAPAAPAQPPDASPPGPEEILARAFANRYELDTRQRVEVVVRNAGGDERRRSLAVASKRIGGRLHSIGRFLEPEYVRGATVLNIEQDGRSDDHFLYLRTLGRIRRVSSGQRADAFMGTDLTYEDFERRRLEDYEVELRPAARLDGEPVHVVSGRPNFASGYARVEFLVAVSDYAILETRYFKRGGERPFKIVHAPRSRTRVVGGHALPTYVRVEDRSRGTQTEVWIHDLSVDPDLDDALFTSSAVEVGRPIPGLE